MSPGSRIIGDFLCTQFSRDRAPKNNMANNDQDTKDESDMKSKKLALAKPTSNSFPYGAENRDNKKGHFLFRHLSSKYLIKVIL
jgi:hypothetical protein